MAHHRQALPSALGIEPPADLGGLQGRAALAQLHQGQDDQALRARGQGHGFTPRGRLERAAAGASKSMQARQYFSKFLCFIVKYMTIWALDMSKHKRYFPTITAEAFTGLLAMYATKSEITGEILRLYAVDGVAPEVIAKTTGLDLGNVLRTVRRAGELLALARVACNAVQRPMKMGPADLRAWLERNGCDLAEGAKLLGISSASMERALNESTFLPRSLALACAAIDAGLEAPTVQAQVRKVGM